MTKSCESDVHIKNLELHVLALVLSEVCKQAHTGQDQILNILNREHNSTFEICFINSLAALMHQIPKSQKQAYEGPDGDQWKAAEIKHLSALLDQNTFELVDLPPGHRAIPTKWVYTRKGGDK